MIKKAILAGSLVLLLVLITVVFFKIKSSDAPITDPLSGIPQDAALILKSNQPLNTWDKLSTTNIMWEELLAVPQIGLLHGQFSVIDTLVVQYPEIKEYLSSQGFYMSIHPKDTTDFEILFTFGIPNAVDPDQAEKVLLNLAGNNRINSEYNKIDLYSTAGQAGVQISYAFVNELLVVSSSESLVKKAIDQSLSGVSITSDPNFLKCYESRGIKEEANVIVSYKNISNILALGLKNSKLIPNNINYFGSWATTDLTLRPNEVQLHGFTALDTNAQFLATFKGQKATEAKVFTKLPMKTSSIIHYSFSNFKGWYDQFRTYLNSRGKLGWLDDNLNEQDERFDVFIEDNILEWVESEMAQAIVHRHKNLQDTLIVLRSSNPEFGFKKMVELSAKSNFGIDNVYPKGDYSIAEIRIPMLANLIFGDLFPVFENTYCVKNENYIFLTSSMSSAERLVRDFEDDKLLSNDRYFVEYAENVPQSNYLIYSNIATSYEGLKRHASETPFGVLAQNESVLKKFQALSMSWSNENDELFYQNVYLKFNPVFKEETNSIWEHRLDSKPILKPSLVKNHYSGAKEIFVQDSEYTVYLISNTGKLLWKRKLDEKIESTVFQVDIFKNNKLQMVFNTKNYIYALDRNGENVSGFPVKLDAPASNTIEILDYSNSKEYRLLIACENNKLYNFDKKGQKIKGWAFKAGNAPVVEPVKFVTVQNKDYLFAIESNGTVRALDRRGRDRIVFKEKLSISKNNSYKAIASNALDNSYIIASDSTGQIVKLFLDDRREVIDLGEFSGEHYFEYSNLDSEGKKEVIVTDKNELKVFDNSGKVLLEKTFENPIQNPQVYNIHGQMLLGVNSGAEIWMFDRTGNMLKGFPLKGSLPFSIADINKDEKFDLISQDSEGNILLYDLDQN